MMRGPTRARALALKVLYEIDLTGHPPETVLQIRLQEEPMPARLARFARRIVREVLLLRPILDRYIAKHAPDWPVENLSPIDRNILRIALWEMALHPKTPLKVAINEAVELAKVFGSSSSPKFINGVLGSMVDDLDALRRELQTFLQAQEVA